MKPEVAGSILRHQYNVDDKVRKNPPRRLLRLSNPTNGAILGTQRTAVLTILDNDDHTLATAKLAKPAAPRAGRSNYAFAVTFADNLLVNCATIGTGDILVTGPKGYQQVATFVSATPTANAASITATYQILAPGGQWDSSDGGAYTIWLQPKQVRDAQGNIAPKQQIGALTVAFAARSVAAAPMVNSLAIDPSSIVSAASPAVPANPGHSLFTVSKRIELFAKQRTWIELADAGL